MTLPEVLLWQRLRDHQLDGFLFRRQHPVGPYVLDFYCDVAKLVVEIDGAVHSNFEQRRLGDQARDAWLGGRGLRVIRLSAKLVLSDMDAAMRTIRSELPAIAPESRNKAPRRKAMRDKDPPP